MNTSLPADLQDLHDRFENWRASRAKLEPIPPELREAALALRDRYSLSAICRACRLHVSSLTQSRHKKRSPGQKKTTRRTQEAGTPQAFFSLTPQPSPPPPQHPAGTAACRVHFARPDGAALAFLLPAAETQLLRDLARDFLKGDTR